MNIFILFPHPPQIILCNGEVDEQIYELIVSCNKSIFLHKRLLHISEVIIMLFGPLLY